MSAVANPGKTGTVSTYRGVLNAESRNCPEEYPKNIDGSFVTAKAEPNDVDAVVWLPADFERQVQQGSDPALELEHMLLTRHPEEIFAAEDETDWNDWMEFFSRTREEDGRRKGLVEVDL